MEWRERDVIQWRHLSQWRQQSLCQWTAIFSIKLAFSLSFHDFKTLLDFSRINIFIDSQTSFYTSSFDKLKFIREASNKGEFFM